MRLLFTIIAFLITIGSIFAFNKLESSDKSLNANLINKVVSEQKTTSKPSLNSNYPKSKDKPSSSQTPSPSVISADLITPNSQQTILPTPTPSILITATKTPSPSLQLTPTIT